MNNKIIIRALSTVLAAGMLISTTGCLHKTVDNKDFPTIETHDTPASTDTSKAASSAVSSAESKTESKAQSKAEASKSESSALPKAKKVELGEYNEKDEIKLTVGEQITLTATIMPTDEVPVWSSTNEDIVRVDERGTVVAQKAGVCTLKLTVRSNANLDREFTVTVKDPVQSSAVSSSEAAPRPEQPSETAEDHHDNDGQTTSENAAVESEEIETTPKKVSNITLTLPKSVLYVGDTITPDITLEPEHVDSREITLTTSDDTIISINDDGTLTANAEGACTITAVPKSNDEISADIIVAVTQPFVPEEHDELPKEECYIDGILIVNKTYSLPKSYNPGGLTAETAAAFEQMRQGAAEDGISLWIESGFRSYDTQYNLYWNYVSYSGQALADTFSARPGHSEHQTGMAIDLNSVYDSFAYTAEAAWIEEHCHEYGFILRYPQGKQDVTGYKYEPWHVRYIGDKATEIYESGLTLEEYYGLSSQYD